MCRFKTFLIIVMLICSFGVFADSEKISDKNTTILKRIEIAKGQRGPHYAKMLKLFIEKAPNVTKGGTVFLGDSITQGFPLEQAFPGQNVTNFGISGDTITGIHERLDVCVKEVKPSRIYIKVGINDLFHLPQNPYTHYVKQYDQLLEDILKNAPQAELIVFSVLPVGKKCERQKARITKLNIEIKKLAKKYDVKYIDLHPLTENKDGDMIPCLTSDSVHLTLLGYYRWLEGFLPREDFLQAAMALSPRYNQIFDPVHTIDKVNPKEHAFPGGRGEHQLIWYDSNYHEDSTGTNEWGIEAVIVNGKVISIQKRDSKIPVNGGVLSGNWHSEFWIKNYLNEGTTVHFNKGKVWVDEAPVESLSSEDAVIRIERDFFLLIGDYASKNQPVSRKVVKLFKKLQKLRKKPAKCSIRKRKSFYKKLNTLKL